MAKFITGNELNLELERLFENADKQIILFSPYIRLHERYASCLSLKKNYPDIEIIIVFGKNEEDFSKSMKEEDFNFFKSFPNIQIRYEKRLHAKYYANENYAILTSMNLYNYSQDNNIEAGVMTKTSLLGTLANNLMNNVLGEDSLDKSAWTYFSRVLEQSEVLFSKIPKFEKVNFGLSKKYIESKTEIDKLTDFFQNRNKYDNKAKQDVPVKKSSPEFHPTFIQKNEPKIESIKPSDAKYLSTTAISKEVGLSSKELFYKFEKLNWIEKNNDSWILTTAGISIGAQTKKGQYGEYIAWPSAIISIIK